MRPWTCGRSLEMLTVSGVDRSSWKRRPCARAHTSALARRTRRKDNRSDLLGKIDQAFNTPLPQFPPPCTPNDIHPQIESKVIYVDLRSNQRGLYLKLSETGGKQRPRSTVLLPATAAPWLYSLLDFYVKEGLRLSSSSSPAAAADVEGQG